MSDNSVFESLARLQEQVAAPPGVYVGPQSYNSQPSSMGMSQVPADIPRGPMGPSVKGSIKVPKPGPDLPRGPIKSNVKGSSSSKPPVQTRSISGPPIHGGPAPNNYYPNPPGGYYSPPPPPPPGNYPPQAPQNSQISANYPYPPASYGGYAAQAPYAQGPSGQPLPPQGGHVGGFYAQGSHAPPPPGGYPPPGSGYYSPTGGYPQAPAGNYPPPASNYPPPASNYPPPASNYPPPASNYPPPASNYPPPAGNYPPSGGYPSHVHAPPMGSNPTLSGEYVQGIGGFATKRPHQ